MYKFGLGVMPEIPFAQIEEASLRAWPAFREERIGPWLVRIGNGYTKRANSATLTASASGLNPLSSVSVCEERYHAARLRPCFRLPSFATNPDVEAFLSERGYDVLEPTQVLSLPLAEAKVPDAAPIISAEAERWIAAFTDLSGSSSLEMERLGQLVGAIRLPHIFAWLERDGVVIACGLGILDRGLFGLFDLITSAEHRSRGHGRQLVFGMLRWARERGAHVAYLQVVESNEGARRLYSRIGFRGAYRYWYRAPSS